MFWQTIRFAQLIVWIFCFTFACHNWFVFFSSTLSSSCYVIVLNLLQFDWSILLDWKILVRIKKEKKKLYFLIIIQRLERSTNYTVWDDQKRRNITWKGDMQARAPLFISFYSITLKRVGTCTRFVESFSASFRTCSFPLLFVCRTVPNLDLINEHIAGKIIFVMLRENFYTLDWIWKKEFFVCKIMYLKTEDGTLFTPNLLSYYISLLLR